ncbi:MAG: 3-deoxy-D-manno-octulosonic acid transferase [Flavobacteriales bacterium]|nr:3-deoxy-D-manno-octulosonic acid transferase [Flavobacteriales bacterium]MCB9192965.1 3-deoxy-D-manno-octulosonic acid transferase [Flavobacteriales bacterium]
MPLGLDLVTRAYHLGIRMAAPFLPKARAWVEGRRGSWDRLGGRAERLQGCIWMHCASVGEFEQGRPVLEALKKALPERPILVTFFSPSGYASFHDLDLATHVDYLPPDGRANARRFLELVRPGLAIFIKYEFWYHYLMALDRLQAPTFLVSGIFRPGQPFFRWYGSAWRRMLATYDRLFVQNERSAELLRPLVAGRVTVSGDTRFDRVTTIAENTPAIPLALAFRKASQLPVLVAGSTWPPDEDLIHEALATLPHQVRTVLVPHEPAPRHLDRIAERAITPLVRWSAIAQELERREPEIRPPHEPPDQDPLFARTLLVDRTGLLSRLYRYGDLAYVGGGFSDGIHSILEAAAWGRPVIFGPRHGKFPEARGLIEAGGGFEVRDARALADVLHRLLGDARELERASLAAGLYVRERIGATHRVVDGILASIDRAQAP